MYSPSAEAERRYHQFMDGLRRLTALWSRSPSSVLIATVATVVGVAALTLGSSLLFGSTDDRAQPDAAPSTALNFAVLAGSTVNNTGLSVITGDVGGARAGNAITGFPPGIVHGAQHGADAVAFQARTDLTTAYFDAANRISDESLPADVGGMTLRPGVYNQAAALSLTGTLTLDGQDNRDALFIFQAGSTLITAPDSVVALTNGAQACNVFWQVGTSATLGANSGFVGSVLSSSSATSLQAGATMDGRVLVRNGDVNLDLSTITMPSCDDTATGPFAKIGTPRSDSSADPSVGDPSTGQSSTQGRSTPGSSTQRPSTTSTSTTTATTTTTPPPPPPVDPPPVDPPPVP
jgi:hypothetical protein